MDTFYHKRMSSGRLVDLANFSKEDVLLGDIEQSINLIYRFGGSWKNSKPLTVAQHSLLCMRLAEEEGQSPLVQMSCLTHDFGEAYVGDVCTSIKKLLGKSWINFAKPIEDTVDKMCNPWGLAPHKTVKYYDRLSFDIENNCMFGEGKALKKHKNMFYDVASYEENAPIRSNYFRLMAQIKGQRVAA